MLLLVVAQGCWLQTGFSRERTGTNPFEDTITAANVADLEAAWTAPLPDGGAATDVVVWRDTAYVRSPNAVTALDTSSGEVRWTTTSLGGSGAPAIARNRLWVPTSGSSCGLTPLDLGTGERTEGRAGVGGPDLSNLGSSSCTAGDVLAVGSDLATTWIYVGSSPAPRCPQGAWAYGSGVTTIRDDSANPGWTLGGLTSGCGNPPTAPTFTRYLALSSNGGSTFVPADTGLGAYPAADCGRATSTGACRWTWSRSLGEGLAAPAVALDNGDLAVPMADGRVVVLDGATGETRWTGNAGAALRVPLAATSTTIFAAADDRTLAAFPVGGCGAATCEPAWTATLSAPPGDQPSIGGDVVYVTNGSAVTAFPAAGCGAARCEARWSAGVSDGTSGPPVIHDGTLYVGATDAGGSAVRAFRLPTPG